MKYGDDLIKFMIKTMQHALGENLFTENLAEQVETQIRQEYGGQAVYVAKTDSDVRRESIIREFNGRNRREICAKFGIGKAHFYRILKGG